MTRIRHLVEYFFFRVLWLLLKVIPASKAYDFGLLLGRWGSVIVPSRKRVAIKNVLLAKITEDPQEAERIAVYSIGHFIGHILETIRAGDKIADNWREHVTVEMSDQQFAFMAACEEPMMITTGHLGVWEIAVPVISSFRPMLAVVQVMKNPYVADFVSRSHFRGRCTVISKKNGFTPKAMRQWEAEKSALTIVMDQRASGKSGLVLSFFGRPVSVFTSPARIALKSGHPIVFGTFVREGLFKYRMYSSDPIVCERTGSWDEDIKNLTQELVVHLEAAIRRWPEQYLWMHNRWK